MNTDLDLLSDLNMIRYYRRELTGVKLGIHPSRNTIRTLNKLGFLQVEHHNPKPVYQLTEKAAKLLEGVSP